MFFGFWELRLKRQLTDVAMQPTKEGVGLEVRSDVSERMRREQILKGLPKQSVSKLKTVVMLKFLFVAILIAEVIVLQR
jgi:hypothetical protein